MKAANKESLLSIDAGECYVSANSRFTLSLKNRITLLTLAVFLLGIWSVTFYATRRLQQDMVGLLGQQQFSSISTVATQVNGEIESRLQALNRVAGEITPALIENPAELQKFLALRTNFHALFNGGVRVRDPKAETLAQIPYALERLGASYADRDYMIAALKEGRTTIGKPVVSRTLNVPVIAMAAPIRAPSGPIIGALTGVINLGQPSFFDTVTNSRIGQTGGYLIIAPQHGLIVTSSDKSRVMSPAPAPGVNLNHDRFAAGYEGFGVAVNSRGVEELAAAKGIPAAGWFLVGVLPTAEAFAPIYATQRQVLWAAVLLSILAGALAWWLVRRMLRQQFEPMLAATRTLAGMAHPAGSAMQPLPVVHEDEVGQLIGSFNRLIESIREHEIALERHRDHLEEQVEQRTEALSVAKEAAETANRAKGTFLANMSHELRTPLHGIMGMLALVRRRSTDPTILDQIDKAKVAADHLLTVLNDILDISKIEADRMVLEDNPMQVGAVLDNLAFVIGHKAADKGLQFILDVPAGLAGLLLKGDPLRLGQILINLAGNAVKFTERGSITVRARLVEDDPDSVLIRFEVADTGIGIDAATQARLFTAFEQADNSMTRKYGGTGLGLAISKRLAKMMGGDIGTDSIPGQGSTFWFTVRLARRTAAAVPSAQTSGPASAEDRLRHDHPAARILMAEDEPINCEVALGLLEDAGLAVDVAVNGLQALELARQHRYALILMDMQMPVLNGIEATQAIRADSLNRDTPVLAMTANAFDEDRQRCLDAGMNAHLCKPVHPDKLFETLLYWLEKPGAKAGD